MCEELLNLVSLDDFLPLVGAAFRTGTMGKLGRLALGAYGRSRRSKEVVSATKILAGLGGLFLGYCHGYSPLRATVIFFNALKAKPAPDGGQSHGLVLRSTPQVVHSPRQLSTQSGL